MSIASIPPSSAPLRASFPLFHMIYNNVLTSSPLPEEPVPTADKNKICRIIKDMDDHHMELVFAIIRCYHLQIDQHSIFENPYQMKKMKQHHYRFDTEVLPPLLLRILLHFITLYEQHSIDTDLNN